MRRSLWPCRFRESHLLHNAVPSVLNPKTISEYIFARVIQAFFPCTCIASFDQLVNNRKWHILRGFEKHNTCFKFLAANPTFIRIFIRYTKQGILCYSKMSWQMNLSQSTLLLCSIDVNMDNEKEMFDTLSSSFYPSMTPTCFPISLPLTAISPNPPFPPLQLMQTVIPPISPVPTTLSVMPTLQCIQPTIRSDVTLPQKRRKHTIIRPFVTKSKPKVATGLPQQLPVWADEIPRRKWVKKVKTEGGSKQTEILFLFSVWMLICAFCIFICKYT